MTNTDRSRHANGNSWEDIGHAAERFARRLAREASTFAERMQEHAGEFAHDVARDWRRTRRTYGCHHRTAPDVRGIFEDVRGVLADIIEGVDELIERVFPRPAASSDEGWVRVVTNREAGCGGCGRTVAAGDEAYLHRAAGGKQFRCLDCGVPPPAAPAS